MFFQIKKLNARCFIHNKGKRPNKYSFSIKPGQTKNKAKKLLLRFTDRGVNSRKYRGDEM